MKKITLTLDTKSIDNAIEELQGYKVELNSKTEKLLDLMLEHGEDYAINELGHIDTGETLSSIYGYRDGDKGVILAGGNAIWLEFGTGIRHNGPAGGSPHPKGTELGMIIGEYGQGKGANPGGWWYYDGDEVKHTYGIPATMFMWRTSRELEESATELAKEVFKK